MYREQVQPTAAQPTVMMPAEISCALTPREREVMISRCDMCGNHYEEPMEVKLQGVSYTFDRLECAIHMLAPSCDHCGCRIVGHGIQAAGVCCCCAHCARQHAVSGVADHG
jgi:hypothetical protein